MQLTYDEAELLASHDYEEPLIAAGVRCHGGFDADGAYVSPRTRHRVPAISAWQANHRATFGTDLLDVPLDDLARPLPQRRPGPLPDRVRRSPSPSSTR